MDDNPQVRRAIRKHALFNAYRHEGRAEAGAVVGKVLGEFPELKSRVKDLFAEVAKVVQETNSVSLGQQISTLEEEFSEEFRETRQKREQVRELPPLEGAERGRVVTRFPPEPNGYPHIGHAKAALIDYTYAKMYSGRFILRFDDTNPAAEKIEYYDAITSGLEWLGIRPDLVKNTSDDLERIYSTARKLLESGHLYVCECNQEKIRERRARGTTCEHRDASERLSVERWERLFSSYRENEAILRFKGDMQDLNTALRDPTMMRIIEHSHPLQGERYRVWPTYDLAAPIEDSLDGVTHALRSKEYELRDALYYTVLDLLGMRKPRLIEFSRLSMRGTPVSKRIFKKLMEEGKVEGWDDPRLPTLLGLQRRGFLPEAINNFALSFGVGKSESEPTWDLLESTNRKLLDPVAKRYFFVPDPIPLEVSDASPSIVTLRHHPDKDLGGRTIRTGKRFFISRGDTEHLSEGDRIRLMELFNVKITAVGNRILGKFGGMEAEEGLKKIQWVPDDGIPFRVKVVGALFEDEHYNEESLKIVEGITEPACSTLRRGESIQFARFGFCRIDDENTAILTHR